MPVHAPINSRSICIYTLFLIIFCFFFFASFFFCHSKSRNVINHPSANMKTSHEKLYLHPSVIQPPSTTNHLYFSFSFQQNYLMDFGYLPKSDIETGNLRTETQLNEAIKTLQRFGNIPETGIIDDETRRLMKRPRCGQPDITNSADFSATNSFNERRKKRYVIQGSKWPNARVTWR